MSVQGPIVVVADQPNAELDAAFAAAGVAQVSTCGFAQAADTIRKTWPSAIVIDELATPGRTAAIAAMKSVLDTMREPYLPVLSRVAPDYGLAIETALPISEKANGMRIAAQVASALRVRTLDATIFRRLGALKSEGALVPEKPDGDPLDDAIVLVTGRGRSYPELCIAVGERIAMELVFARERNRLSDVLT